MPQEKKTKNKPHGLHFVPNKNKSERIHTALDIGEYKK
jgi:hypothetical protein